MWRATGRTLRASRLIPLVQTHVPSRSLVLPLVGAGAGKMVAALALKKLAMHSILRKLGAERAIGELRRLNDRVRSSSPDSYSPHLHQQVDTSLVQLEAQLVRLRESERIQAAWSWFESLEKDHPSVARVIMKSYIESFAPVKYWGALMRSTPKPDCEAAKYAAAREDASALRESAARETEMLRKIRAAVPEVFGEYHVVLIPKAPGHEEDAANVSTQHETVTTGSQHFPNDMNKQ